MSRWIVQRVGERMGERDGGEEWVENRVGEQMGRREGGWDNG